MKKLIKLKPIHQTGHNCKITAIATVDQYFADQLGFEPIPLHKKKNAPMSMRQLSKTKGSRQGELLEHGQLAAILTDLGYETELIDFQDDYNSFQNHVTDNIKKEKLVIACFALDRATSLPATHYETNSEHAAVLHGFDDETGALDMTHWDMHRKTTMKNFYDSSMILLKQRNPEYYINIKHLNKDKKYDLHSDQTGKYLPKSGKKSITPAPDSGFRGKLLVIKKPVLKNILAARQKLLNHVKLAELFTKLKLKTDELINKGTNEYLNQYKDARDAAIKLNAKLDKAKKRFLIDHTIDFDQFKQKCNTAIQAAEPIFKKHRGWYQIHVILRAILGVLATATVIPALAVAAGTKQGYVGTFFKKEPKTDSEKKLELFKHDLNNLK